MTRRSGKRGRWLAAGLFLAILFGMSKTEPLANDNEPTALAVVGGGCFWCIEAVFEAVPGVVEAVSGYAGGALAHPTYDQVCSGTTGHAEVVQIRFNPKKISYAELLDLFWLAHDPTTLNRQGADEGPQYRSIILYQNQEQRQIAEAAKAHLQKKMGGSVVTEIVPLDTFYPAEAYHQDYYRKNPSRGYCTMVIRPKLEKLDLLGK
jgi:peptide-methionine (S)-S-oxide reductase